MTLGLVLGKFAPLHRGHQLVLDAATHQTENQVVVIYDSPSTTDIPLAVRARWVRVTTTQAGRATQPTPPIQRLSMVECSKGMTLATSTMPTKMNTRKRVIGGGSNSHRSVEELTQMLTQRLIMNVDVSAFDASS